MASHRQIANLANPTSPAGSIILFVAFNPDGHTLATADGGGGAGLWDLSSHRQIGGPIHAKTSWVAFSPDGHTLATANTDGTIGLWDVTSRQRIATLNGHTQSVYKVVFSPDGRTLATASHDDTARLWDVARRQPLATLTGHTGYVSGVAFSPDGRTLATASDDDSTRLWNLDTDQVTDRLCHIIGAPSRADWARLIPDLPYQPSCR